MRTLRCTTLFTLLPKGDNDMKGFSLRDYEISGTLVSPREKLSQALSMCRVAVDALAVRASRQEAIPGAVYSNDLAPESWPVRDALKGAW